MKTESTLKPKRPYVKLPCLKCITLPSCLSVYKRHVQEEHKDLRIDALRGLITLFEICSLLDRYSEKRLTDEKYQNYTYKSAYRIKRIHVYFYNRLYGEDKNERNNS